MLFLKGLCNCRWHFLSFLQSTGVDSDFSFLHSPTCPLNFWLYCCLSSVKLKYVVFKTIEGCWSYCMRKPLNGILATLGKWKLQWQTDSPLTSFVQYYKGKSKTHLVHCAWLLKDGFSPLH